MRNVSAKSIARILGCVIPSDFQVAGYQIDSRMIEPGELFFALSGKRVEGTSFLKEAAFQGASSAVVPKRYLGPNFGLTLFHVEDVLFSLQSLASFFIKDAKPEIVGITGSLGKTMTKDFAAHFLGAKFKVGKTRLSYNSQRTYPLMLLNRGQEEEVLVLELGMSEPHEIEKLIAIAAPDIAALTKVSFAHIGNFGGDIGAIAEHKADIFISKKTRTCIFDHDLYRFSKAIQKTHSQKISFSLKDPAADVFLSSEFFVDEKGVRTCRVDPPQLPRHFLHNFLAAAAIARSLKVSWDEINSKIPTLTLPKMRFEPFEKDGALFLNDAYNANPESMCAALENLPEPKNGGKRIAVLGMMVEMGKDHEKMHKDVGHFARKCVDHLLVFGKEASGIYEGFQESQKPAESYLDLSTLAKRLDVLVRPGDVVLVKGSRVLEMEKLFGLLELC